jgi:hypothetical protein
MNKKVTIATVKAFIRKNRNALLVRVASSFDGMTDCVEPTSDRNFIQAQEAYHKSMKHNMEINGVWFVNGSRNYVSPLFADGYSGFEVYNCCGKWAVAIKA